MCRIKKILRSKLSLAIIYNEKEKVIHLQTNNTSYVMQLYPEGYLVHLYWGKRIRNISNSNKLITATSSYNESDNNLNMDVISQEYPGYGCADFRDPAYQVQLENGTTICDLRYHSHRVFKGKAKLEGLPSTYAENENENEAETLEITLVDSYTGLNVILIYTVFEMYNVITRSVKFINNGTCDLKLLRALSMSVDFDNSNYNLLQLSGAWAREKHIYKRPLLPGTQSIESKRGISSHQQNPFIALLGKDTNEVHGEVYGFNLVYSGNFIAKAEVDQFFSTRVLIGLNPFDFSWLLEPSESFQSPEAVLVYSNSGLGEMSRIYHNFYRQRLCRGVYRDKVRPILVNNWEATYFDFDEEKIEKIADVAKELGIELFVLDDGWFGKRDSDNCSLGDWIVNKKKLPNGLGDLAKKINKNGLSFGLWFEPEMVSPDSDLYRKHPDWCIHVPNRVPAQGRFQRNQLVLDLSRQDVCDEIIKMVSSILNSVPISYVKWDMNRSLTDIGSELLQAKRQRETAHRYVLGLYRVMDEITRLFPDILFESCSSGGARFDPGILYYMPQTWASDNTDAVERLKIQYGTSIVYPLCSIGSHVSASPNHQIGRIIGFDIRGNVAMAGTFGYELDLTKLTRNEKEIVKKQIEMFKEIRHIVQFGEFYRIWSPFEGNETAWMFISNDKKEIVVSYFKVLAEPFAAVKRLKLQGLDANSDYKVLGIDTIVGGDELMNIGLEVKNNYGDFSTEMWKIKLLDI